MLWVLTASHGEDGGQTLAAKLHPIQTASSPQAARWGASGPNGDLDVVQQLETQMGSGQGPWGNQYPLHDHSNNHVILRATPSAASAPSALTFPRVERAELTHLGPQRQVSA